MYIQIMFDAANTKQARFHQRVQTPTTNNQTNRQTKAGKKQTKPIQM
jgi:hypothetical protein